MNTPTPLPPSPAPPRPPSAEHPRATPAGDEHRRAWDAIPWVVAGAASGDESLWVQAHLPQCSECQAEWALQQRVHAGLNAAEPAQLPDPAPALRSLMARLDAGTTYDPGEARPAGLTTRPQPTPWTRWLAAAVLVQAIGLGAAGLVLFDRHGQGASNEGEYRTLSQATTPAPAATLRLVLAPGMDFSTLRLLLARTRLVAVEVGADGNSLGLAAADGDPRTVSAALPVLRAAAAVMLAEPITAKR